MSSCRAGRLRPLEGPVISGPAPPFVVAGPRAIVEIFLHELVRRSMATDRKTLTDADIVSRRTGRGGSKQGGSDSDAQPAGDHDGGTGVSRPKGAGARGGDRSADRAKDQDGS